MRITTYPTTIPRTTLLILALAGSLFLTAGCEKGSGEKAGEKVDDVVEDVKDTAEDVGDEIEDAVDEIDD